jgi:hypothetical protein
MRCSTRPERSMPIIVAWISSRWEASTDKCIVDLTFLAAMPLEGFKPEREDRFRAEVPCCSAVSEPIGLTLPGRLPLCHPTAKASGPEIQSAPCPPLLDLKAQTKSRSNVADFLPANSRQFTGRKSAECRQIGLDLSRWSRLTGCDLPKKIRQNADSFTAGSRQNVGKSWLV